MLFLKEAARDLLALGSIPFYFIVYIRAVIGRYELFMYYLPIAFVILLILSYFFKGNMHIARGLVLMVFISFFYQVKLFTIFAALLWILMVFSFLYLKKKPKEIIKGVIFGIATLAITHFGVQFFIN